MIKLLATILVKIVKTSGSQPFFYEVVCYWLDEPKTLIFNHWLRFTCVQRLTCAYHQLHRRVVPQVFLQHLPQGISFCKCSRAVLHRHNIPSPDNNSCPSPTPHTVV